MVTAQEFLAVELKVPKSSAREIELHRCPMTADYVGNFIVVTCDRYRRVRQSGGHSEWCDVIADEGLYLAKCIRDYAKKKNVQLVLADARADISRVLLGMYSKLAPIGAVDGNRLHATDVNIYSTSDDRTVIFTLSVMS